MSLKRLPWMLLLALLVSGYAGAATLPLVDEAVPVAIALGQTREFQFGTVSQANTTVLLKIKSRMDFPSLGGSMQFMRMTLNGREVQAAVGRSAQRLLNRPFRAPVTPSLEEAWYDAGAPGRERGWKVIYAPDFTAALAQSFYIGNPYEIVLDITDLINPVAENRLTIENTTTPGFAQANVKPATGKLALDLVIGSMQIETNPGASPMMAVPPSAVPVINRGTPGSGPAKYRGEVLPGGGLALHVGKSTYRLSSSFSYPDAGFNALAAGARPSGGQPGWQVAVKGNRVTATGPDYTIVRTVTFGPRRVAVAEAITNRHRDEPLGLCVRHELDLGGLKDPSIRLAGNPDPSINDYISYGNPSVHVVTPEGALGLLADDDVFRNQAHLYTQPTTAERPGVAGLRTEMLRLAPGETYALRWAVYPVAGPDFYDFVNLVRADWNANYPVPGIWVWGVQGLDKMSLDEVRALFQRERIQVVFAPDWVDWTPTPRGTQRIGYGSDVFSDYWAERRQTYLAEFTKLRQACPDVKVAAYYNTMRESADDTPQRFADSLMLNTAGQPLVTVWTNVGAKNPTWAMVPTLTNSFGREMLEIARRYMDDMKTDGIYWDEAEGMQFGQILTTERQFDGHSCLLDPQTWRIKREVGIVPLVTRPFLDAVVQLVQQRGGPLLVNGPTGSSHTVRDRVQRMTEAQHNDTYGYEGLLQSPLAYMSWSVEWEQYLRVLGLGLLPVVRIPAALPHDLSPYLVPFTPRELHAGYLLGKERIIATHSGNYGWPGERSLVRVRHFSDTGKLITTDFPTTIGTEARTAVTLADKEAVVLERVPLSLKPQGQAQASQLRYSAAGLAVQLQAPKGGVLTVASGEMPLREGAVMKVSLGRGSRSVTVKKGLLTIPLPAGFAGTVALAPTK